MQYKKYEIEWLGHKLILEFNKLALQANSNCLVRYKDTVVLATVTMSKEDTTLDYFPLTVEYQEKYYATGKIKGSRFIKRETRPSNEAILSARLVDRAIRPLFNEEMRRDIQVVLTTLSIDPDVPTNVAMMIAASAALQVSEIPFAGPVVGIQIAEKDNKLLLNPTSEDLELSKFDVYLASNGEKLLMVEAEGQEMKEEEFLNILDIGHEQVKPIIKFLQDIERNIGKEKMLIGDDAIKLLSEEEQEKYKFMKTVLEDAKNFVHKKVDDVLLTHEIKEKHLRKESLDLIKKELKVYLNQKGIEEDLVNKALNRVKEFTEEKITEFILKTKKRIDGRGIEDIRPLYVETSLLPRTHGSGLFQRGETQVLSILTLGAPGDEQILDGVEITGSKRYIHHYNFPGYSVGEPKPFRGASRRDIGHGALAEKALRPMIPSKEDFPYTIRVVSEVMGSNGSSSMASVCASTLALMDGGVPIKKPVAGIAMGLVSNDKEWIVLTDLQDLEDAKGGMDFKIAGTVDGITAIQMDTKTHGLSREIVKQTVFQARKARLQILQVMDRELSAPRQKLSEYAPRIEVVKIDPDKIRTIIGPGGKQINEIIEDTGVSIDIEEDGNIFITSIDQIAMDKAKRWIKNLTKEVKPGEIYDARITKIMDFGAFAEVLPGQEGLIHISEISHKRVNKVSDVLKVGDIVKVKVKDIDQMGRLNLSIKALEKKENHLNHRRSSYKQNKTHKKIKR